MSIPSLDPFSRNSALGSEPLGLSTSPFTNDQINNEIINDPDSEDNLTQVIQAIESAIESQQKQVLGYLIHDIQLENIKYSVEKNWAISWMVYIDSQTGNVIPGEPGLALAYKDGSSWVAILPVDSKWEQTVINVPSDLMTDLEKETWLNMYQKHMESMDVGPFGGYLLPWKGGETLYLTRSIFHYNPPDPNGSMHYAFDFAGPDDQYGSGPMFELYASKSGTVKYARWIQENHDATLPGNYIVLEDTSTTPTTYQLYLHLAKDSIPSDLRIVGTQVQQGHFIGIADDTGYSTDNHLHFHVHTLPNSYWGNSVDITFQDVSINWDETTQGGRPRTPLEAGSYPQYGNEGKSTYISGNTVFADQNPPTGDILDPLAWVTSYSQTLHLEGWAIDTESGISGTQFIARYDGLWHDVGPILSGSLFSYEWNWCSDNVPDGPVSLTIVIEDHANNRSAKLLGLRHLIKHYSCLPEPSPPPCYPSDNEIALFSGVNYSGDCTILGIGEYPISASLGTVGDNAVSSIMLGDGIRATLFSYEGYSGRSETYDFDDSNLSENMIGENTLSSIKVLSTTSAPQIPQAVFPETNTVFSDTESITTIWKNIGNATEFQARLQSNMSRITSTWEASITWHLGSQAAGTYTWTIRSANSFTRSDWSQPALSFTITENNNIISATVPVPYIDTFENEINNWTISGLWHLDDNSDNAQSGTHSWWYGRSTEGDYDTGDINYGTLTSPIISLPYTTTTYFFSFWSNYQAENTTHWDQRWVQLSLDGGRFTNIHQLVNDPPSTWLKNTINLTPFISGTQSQTIQIRFSFITVDEFENNQKGWFIDDFQVYTDAEPSCSDPNEPNETLFSSTVITYSTIITAEICPGGDYDIYKLQGKAGERIAADIDAKSTGSTLDAYLFLYDSDGSSLLAEHDDEIIGIHQDPHLGYVLPHDGMFYFFVRAFDHPQGKGDYSISIITDTIEPQGAIISPVDYSFLPEGQITISSTFTDTGSGIRNVIYSWHSGDWENDYWVEIGQDWDGSDSWNIEFDTSGLGEQTGLALYAEAYDWAGNWTSSGLWNLEIDATIPDTSAEPLPNPSDNTAVHLKWGATDNASGVREFDIRYRHQLTSTWEQLASNLSSNVSDWWFIGDPDNTYVFRIRAVDNVGNIEPFDQGAEISTTIPSANVLCAYPDAWDIDEVDNDNESDSATLINPLGLQSTHNFCNPEHINWANDEDWIKFNVKENQHYLILVSPQSESTAAIIEVFHSDGTTLITEAIPQKFGQSTFVFWNSNLDETIYARLYHPIGKVLGEVIEYTLLVSEGFRTFIPLVKN